MILSFNLTAAHATRLTDALCGLHNYQETVPDPEKEGEMIQNPETKAKFAQRQVKEWMIAQVLRYEEKIAKEAAAQSLTSISVTEL
jgi:hypothetical protein